MIVELTICHGKTSLYYLAPDKNEKKYVFVYTMHEQIKYSYYFFKYKF